MVRAEATNNRTAGIDTNHSTMFTLLLQKTLLGLFCNSNCIHLCPGRDATYIMVLFFTHIPFVANHTINATPPEKLQHYHLANL